MAQPQNTIPIPIKTLVIIAGVEWNCVNVYKIIPLRWEKRERDTEGIKKQAHEIKWKMLNEHTFATANGKHDSTRNLPVKNIGMLMKKPPTAHTRLTLDFCRYLLPL